MAATTASIVFSTQVTHIGSGASLAAGAISASTDVSTALASTNMGRYPLCDVALMIAPTASVALASNTIALFRRDLDIDSTNDETAPGTSNEQKYMGTFQIKATTTASTTHYCQLTDIPLSSGAHEFFIKNTLGVNIPIGWTLKVTPKSTAFA